MKIMKKTFYIVIFILLTLFLYSGKTNAAKVKIATETLNLREKPSTTSEVVAMLSEGIECDIIGESGDWYKVKYKSYTGYVSKEYVKKMEDTSSNNKVEKTKTENTTKSENDDKVQQNNMANDGVIENGKINDKTEVRIVPLIYSSKIGEIKKNENVTILSEINGWLYIQTNSITGWIRKDKITNTTPIKNDNSTNNNKKTSSNENNTNIKEQETSYTERTMYVNESSVNVRKDATTSSNIIMVLGINTKLTVIGESGDWYKVKTSEGNGFVLKKLLSSKQVTSSRGRNSINHTVVPTDDKNVNEDKSTNTSNNKASDIPKEVTSTSSNTKKGQQVVDYAKKFLGVPYVYGGASKAGFDCSGFTMYVYKHFGISMIHGAKSQSKIGKTVKFNKKSSEDIKQNLKAGDLVFFLDYETMDEIGHCGIYIGDGKFIHASSGSGYCVKINSLLPGDYYNTRFCAAKRIF